MAVLERLRNGWDVFLGREHVQPKVQNPVIQSADLGPSYFTRPDRSFGGYKVNDILTKILNRVSVDCASIDVKHVRLDEHKRFKEEIPSGLHRCFNIEANIDQSAWAFKQDIFQTLLEEGTIAIVPVSTSISPYSQGSFDINTMRVGTIVEWMPRYVKVKLFDDTVGRFKEIVVPKSFAAIIENPFYSIMNSPNSTLKRLMRKITLLDSLDEKIGAGKLDLLIQLPYVVKTDTKRQQAEKRRTELEAQLQNSNYGVAYTDGTEKVIQLNRPIENNLLKNVEALTNLLYSELGITAEVLNGTASEEAMLNYQMRIIKPLLIAVTEGIKRKFISKTGITQGQSIEFYHNPFELVPMSNIAELADKFTRNEILSSNEVRQIIGFYPVNTQEANELSNKNMPKKDEISPEPDPLLDEQEHPEESEKPQNGSKT